MLGESLWNGGKNVSKMTKLDFGLDIHFWNAYLCVIDFQISFFTTKFICFMMSEKTENRLATFVAVIIGLLMAVGINAQTYTVNGDWSGSMNDFAHLVANNPEDDFVFNGNVTITSLDQHQALPDFKCVFVNGYIANSGGGINSLKLQKSNMFVTGSIAITIIEDPNLGGKLTNKPDAEGCGVTQTSLPVEAVEFYYQDRGNGTGSFKLVVTDEYDIEQYKIELTDQDNIDIGYKWWYASETQDGLYRVYEIPVTLPTDCADIDFIYAKVYKMESSTMEYEQILNTISILNQ